MKLDEIIVAGGGEVGEIIVRGKVGDIIGPEW